MEKVLNSYESLFIVDLSNGEEAAKAVVTKFLNRIAKNGEIVEVADWGKRRLAYPINDMNEGYYTVVTFKAEASSAATSATAGFATASFSSLITMLRMTVSSMLKRRSSSLGKEASALKVTTV